MLNSRLRILGNLSYNYAEDVSDPGPLTSYYVYDNIWVVTTGGVEFEIVPGNTVEVTVASKDVRRLVRARTNKITKNRGPGVNVGGLGFAVAS